MNLPLLEFEVGKRKLQKEGKTQHRDSFTQRTSYRIQNAEGAKIPGIFRRMSTVKECHVTFYET